MAALERLVTVLGVRLPAEMPVLLGSALRWAGSDPFRNSLTPGFVPLEYSFSSWHPSDLRVAAQLFMSCTASERFASTVKLVRRLAGRYLQTTAMPDFAESSAAVPQRFGAFFGLTAGPCGLTGLEAYLEAGEFDAGLPDHCWESLRPVLRPVFTGNGVRDRVVVRRSYLAVTQDLEASMLGRVLSEAVPSEVAPRMQKALRDVTRGQPVLPAGTVMVTSAPQISMCSVELHAASYGIAVPMQLARLSDLRSRAFVRWAAATGGRDAIATVISIRFSERNGPGTAVYAVPAWACQPASLTSRPMTCPSTDSARTRPVA